MRVVLLGSSPLLLQAGLTESLAGRFEIIPVPHWSFTEMREAFGWTLEQYLYFGGYPGAADAIHDEERWRLYIRESLIETTISRDVLLLKRIDKPALMRQVMTLACLYSGQVVSYTKMLGQLQDSRNTTIISEYLHLLGSVGMVSGLQKFSDRKIRQRASSPKLQVWNTALLSSASEHTFESAQRDRVFWGHLVESAAGAHLLNSTLGSSTEVLYWAARGKELDFVLRRGRDVMGIEIRSGRPRGIASGLEAFISEHPGARGLMAGPGGVPFRDFLETPAPALLRKP